jgi:hypothetical protein
MKLFPLPNFSRHRYLQPFCGSRFGRMALVFLSIPFHRELERFHGKQFRLGVSMDFHRATSSDKLLIDDVMSLVKSSTSAHRRRLSLFAQ